MAKHRYTNLEAEMRYIRCCLLAQFCVMVTDPLENMQLSRNEKNSHMTSEELHSLIYAS